MTLYKESESHALNQAMNDNMLGYSGHVLQKLHQPAAVKTVRGKALKGLILSGINSIF